jgi:hypothetical protein
MNGAKGFCTPVPHGITAAQRVALATERLRESLDRWKATAPQYGSDYWLGIIADSACYLLITLDEQEAVRG